MRNKDLEKSGRTSEGSGRIVPRVSGCDFLCSENAAGPGGMVVFGGSGDLVRRKLLPSLFHLFERGLVPAEFYLIGCGRKKFDDSTFRQAVGDALRRDGVGEDVLKEFLERIFYIQGEYDDPDFYEVIRAKIDELKSAFKASGSLIYYLSVPPQIYGTIIERLGEVTARLEGSGAAEQAKIVIEKPFGRDYESAVELNKLVHRWFDESQIYRIDHYLGKETVQNILMFRFANAIFEPVWNRTYIDSVQITIAETVGVGYRGGYYDSSGALRDMFQNHMLQMVSLVAMEAPTSFEADRVRDEKVKLLRSIRPFRLEPWEMDIVRGQYGGGEIKGERVCGYRDEGGVADNSGTETFVAAKLFIDNWRWKGVPFYLRTGKRLAAKKTEIAITFKKVPHSMFYSGGLADIPANTLVLRIQPHEGVYLGLQAKQPGSKICMATLNMDLDYEEVFGIKMPEAYERLLLDCMSGDQTLFTRGDDVEAAWRLLSGVFEAWEKGKGEISIYPAGSESFEGADALIEGDGHEWRRIAGG